MKNGLFYLSFPYHEKKNSATSNFFVSFASCKGI